MAAADLNTQNDTYRKLPGNGLTYRVPRFQRDYSWGEDEWDGRFQTYIGYLDPVTLASRPKSSFNRNNDSYYRNYLVALPESRPSAASTLPSTVFAKRSNGSISHPRMGARPSADSEYALNSLAKPATVVWRIVQLS
jgi:hypothetical protein